MKRIAIVGYGNLGKACEKYARESDDIELVGIFSRRSGLSSRYGTPIFPQNEIYDAAHDIDVAALCLGSANDLAAFGLSLAGKANTVDSFDTHAKMRDYIAQMDARANDGGKLSLVGIGWDPGLFSLARALFDGAMPDGVTNTFWGEGVSQGHSEAIRRIDGVEDAIQYTVPKREAMRLAMEGRKLSDAERHRRVCYVVAKEGADRDEIERKIREMPNYFAGYEVDIRFIDAESLKRDHGGMPHGGKVTRVARGNKSFMEFSLRLESNPQFTAGVLMRYAVACADLNASGERGAKTILDIPISAILKGEDKLGFV